MIKNERGFSLIELVVALAIMAIFSLVIYIAAGAYLRKTHAQAVVAQVDQIVVAITSHNADHYGLYPRDFGDLNDYMPTSDSSSGNSGSPLGMANWQLTCNSDGSKNEVLTIIVAPDIVLDVLSTLCAKYNMLGANGGVVTNPPAGNMIIIYLSPIGQADCRLQ